MEGSVQMVYVPGMSPMVSKERANVCFRAKMSWVATVVGGVDLARLGMLFLGVGVFRAGLSFTVPLGWEGVSG